MTKKVKPARKAKKPADKTPEITKAEYQIFQKEDPYNF